MLGVVRVDEFDRKGSGEAQQCAKLDGLFDGT
jgi:hypothetical protein